MSNFVYKQPKIDHQKSPHRRSQRKVKRINKDEFLQIYQKHKKDKTTPSQNYFHHTTLNHLEQKCMHMIQSHTHQSTFLMLQEMNNAFEEQKQKLQNYFKIKLNQIPSNSFEAKLNFSIHKKSTDMNQSERAQECTKSLSENKQYLFLTAEHLEPMKYFNGDFLDQKDIGMEMEQSDEEECSFEEMNLLLSHPKLKKENSHKLFCDNYEKHELVYSIDNLIPLMVKEEDDLPELNCNEVNE